VGLAHKRVCTWCARSSVLNNFSPLQRTLLLVRSFHCTPTGAQFCATFSPSPASLSPLAGRLARSFLWRSQAVLSKLISFAHFADISQRGEGRHCEWMDEKN